jgi:hypothetical protein
MKTNCSRFLIFFSAFILTVSSYSSEAQRLSKNSVTVLDQLQDTLKVFAKNVVSEENPAARFRNDSLLIRTLIRALKNPFSFDYAFDSVGISKVCAPDSSFRIFTWQVQKDAYVVFQKGAIQMNTADGSLKLFPLFDNSMFTDRPQDSVRSNKNWIGAIYYRIIQKEFKGKKYYTLIGFDEFSISSNKKWMEVLYFNPAGEPVFGGPFFSYAEDDPPKPVQARYVMEYKKEAKAYLNFDPELDLIIVDHLQSENEEPDNRSTYIPVGDYEGFKWKEGKWVHVNKVFHQRLEDGQFPMEEALYDASGNPNEEKLQKASQKNAEKEVKKPASNSPKAPVKKSGN